MPSTASQAAGAARAHSRNVKRRKRELAREAIARADALDNDTGRSLLVEALVGKMSEPELRALAYQVGTPIERLEEIKRFVR